MSDIWIYENDSNNDNRYLLGERGKHILFCMGINPSTAEPDALDPTLDKVKKIAKHNKFDGWIMINVYPERKTKFEELSMCGNDKIHRENIRHIAKLVDKYANIDIWVAFGNHLYDREYLRTYLIEIYDLLKEKANWYTVGTNKSGAPTHPLYQSGESDLVTFDMKSFIKSLKTGGK